MYKSYFWGYGGGHGHRTRRGDISPLILQLLQEKPMHGYEIISRLEEKSHGFWRPSAGAVYPNLQMMEEQELVTSKDENGKKVYSVTEKGKKAAKETEEAHKARWEERDKYMKAFKDVKGIMFESMGLLKQIASEGSDEKNSEAKKILNEARDKLAKLADKK